MKKMIYLLLILMFFIAGCGNDAGKAENEGKEASAPEAVAKTSEEPVNEEPDIEAIKAAAPNELGRVMILEYHTIGNSDGRWKRSAQSFRKDLEKLYKDNYVLVSLEDVVNGDIDIPLGKSPVVLTFDDGTEGHFRYLKENEELKIDPDSAVGVIKAFNELHPDFGMEATFYVNYYAPFGQKDLYKEKIKTIIDLGMDIGNHTANHVKLKNYSKEEVEKELALVVKMVKEVVPDYEIKSLALPYGIFPKDFGWTLTGEYDGIKYNNIAVLLVGSTPIPSPYDGKLNPVKLERIQVFEDNLDKWMNYFVKNPQKRYISDGEDGYIFYPQDLEVELNFNADSKEVVAY